MIVAQNRFATVYSARLPPGTVGVDVKFRNESTEPARIEVAAVRGVVAKLGIAVGDVLVVFGGHVLPKVASALELEDLVSRHESVGAILPVDVLVWRNESRFHNTEPGEEVVVSLTKNERAKDIVWAPIRASEGRQLYAMARGPSKRKDRTRRTSAFEPGLILVGINHEPVPEVLTLSDLIMSLDHKGPVLLNMWRVSKKSLRSSILKRCEIAAAQSSKSTTTTTTTFSLAPRQDCRISVPAVLCQVAACCTSSWHNNNTTTTTTQTK